MTSSAKHVEYSDFMLRWIERVWRARPRGSTFFSSNNSWLVFDSCSAHLPRKTKKMQEQPVDIDRELRLSATNKIVIPGGMTPLLQPLDVAINRSFKANLARRWKSIYSI